MREIVEGVEWGDIIEDQSLGSLARGDEGRDGGRSVRGRETR